MIRKKIGDILIEKGLITTAQLDDALKTQRATGAKLGQILVEKGLITENQLAESVAARLNIPRISLKSVIVDPQVIATVPVELARRYSLIPVFKINNVLTVAMADPLNIIAIDELKYLSHCDVRRVIALQSEIEAAIDEYYSVADSIQEVIGDYPVPEKPAARAPKIATGALGDDDTPVVKLVDLIINRAIKDKASDIHIEPDEDRLRIRYRINGVMREEASPPKNLQSEIISRIKVAAGMDVSEKRLPQDGRLTVPTDHGDVDLRISTLPTVHGEKTVIRILDKHVLNIGLDHLGFDENLLERWRRLIDKKEGLILITGPTSSGKTTTLYSVLQEINSIEKNIITVEDPVEYSLPLINQVQTNEKAGLTFASLLRYILRQNPDTIMIGEIRDSETARMAMRSALTGHLVFSTLHTNDAPGGIARLLDMDLENYLVASALKGILAQRLLRTNCPNCRQEYTPGTMELKLAGLHDQVDQIKFYKAPGCKECRMSGYQGQTGIFELLEIDDTMVDLIIGGASEIEMKNHATDRDYRPLFETGLDLVKNGSVPLEELLRVLSITDGRSRSEKTYNTVRVHV